MLTSLCFLTWRYTCDFSPPLCFSFFFSNSLDFWEVWKMLIQGFIQCDKTAAVNSCQIGVVTFGEKCFVRLKPPGLCWSFTVQCFIMLRTLFTLIALQLLSKLPYEASEAPQCLVSLKPFHMYLTLPVTVVSALYQLTGLNLSHEHFLTMFDLDMSGGWSSHLLCLLPPATYPLNCIILFKVCF